MVIELLVSMLDRMVLSSPPTFLSSVRVNHAYPLSILMQEPKVMRKEDIEPEIYRGVKVTNIGWCVIEHAF